MKPTPTNPIAFKKNGHPKSSPGRATVFGVANVAVQVRYVDVSPPPAHVWERAPAQWEVSASFGMTAPALAKLIRDLGDAVRIRHTSEFDGMIDGSRQVNRVVSTEGFLAWLQPEKNASGFSRTTGSIYFHDDDGTIHAFDCCDSYRVEWVAEIERREATLQGAPLPDLRTDEHDAAFIRSVSEARTRYLAGRDPMEWDDAHAALRGLGMDDPMEVIRLVNPRWHASLLTNSEKRAA